MKYDFSAREISNQGTAIATHKRLKAANESLVVIGRFYLALIEQGLWPTQKALASELGVSGAHMSRMLAAARLPEEVLRAFGDRHAFSFADIATLQFLVKENGEQVIKQRARAVPQNTRPEDVLGILTTGKRSAPRGIRIRLGRDRKHLRVESPNIERLIPRIEELEQFFNVLLASDLATAVR
ncbi:hypothetical protein OKW34_003368 [Paraburkholderia youngii]|uniref:hypothetical protein n=1 Tax=Paraburkholderia youngii TaxID=2782701 RepID=UPI003D1D214D